MRRLEVRIEATAKRPVILIEIQREVLCQARHHRAVSCESTPLVFRGRATTTHCLHTKKAALHAPYCSLTLHLGVKVIF